MKFASFLALVAAPFAVALADTIAVTHNPKYDTSSTSLGRVLCADIFFPQGLTTFGALASYPNIGASPVITKWDSPYCASCWELSVDGKSVNVLALDSSASGTFETSQSTLDFLTGGSVDSVTVDVKQVDRSACGLSW